MWELLVKWNQIKFKGKSNERKIEIRRKEKKIEERKEKKRLGSLARAMLGKVIQLFQYAAVMRDGGWWWMGEEEFSPHSISYLWFRVKTFLWVFASCDGWWMVDSGGGWCRMVKKKFFNFAKTWHTGSSR